VEAAGDALVVVSYRYRPFEVILNELYKFELMRVYILLFLD
jgi:hypothetical protein